MNIIRTIAVTLILAGVVSGCVVVAHPRPWHPCYRCY
jgi:hypothetical protein